MDQKADRMSLGFFPTPLHPLKRFSDALGDVPIWIKRDDCTGLGLGGNKVRKLEYIMARALAEQAEVVITTGALSSNHARQTAAAAASLGVDCHLVLCGKPPEEIQGNLLLDRLLGATISCVRLNEVQEAIDRVMNDYRRVGKKPFFIPAGGHTPEGALAYSEAFREIIAQSPQPPQAVITAVGTGTTFVGLELGRIMTGSSTRVIGVSVGAPEEVCRQEALEMLHLIQDMMGLPLSTAESLNLTDRYVGDGYTRMYPEVRTIIEQLARTEGVFLDPVYTAKAMVGLADMVRRGMFNPNAPVVFLHTGGAPELFSFHQFLSSAD